MRRLEARCHIRPTLEPEWFNFHDRTQNVLLLYVKREINVLRLNLLLKKIQSPHPHVQNVSTHRHAAILFCAFNLRQEKLTLSYKLSPVVQTGVLTNFYADIMRRISKQISVFSLV